MLKRILRRGKTGEREDDNIETAKKRFETHRKEEEPLRVQFKKLGKYAEADGSGTIEEESEKVIEVLRLPV